MRMKKIPLINSRKKALIDDKDLPLISRFQWKLGKDGCAWTTINGVPVEMGYMVLFPQVAEKAEGHN
jgi:hypothetical protein